MKLHSVVRIGLVSLMLVGAFVAGQHYSRTAAAQSPQKWEYRLSVAASAAPAKLLRSTSWATKVGR